MAKPKNHFWEISFHCCYINRGLLLLLNVHTKNHAEAIRQKEKAQKIVHKLCQPFISQKVINSKTFLPKEPLTQNGGNTVQLTFAWLLFLRTFSITTKISCHKRLFGECHYNETKFPDCNRLVFLFPISLMCYKNVKYVKTHPLSCSFIHFIVSGCV